MAKGKVKGRKGRSSSPTLGKDEIAVPVHVFASTAAASNTAAFSASPSGLITFATRLAGLADEWTMFRWSSLRFRLHPVGTSVTCAYIPGVQDANTFNSRSTAAEVVSSVVMTSVRTTPTEWCAVSKDDLSGPFPWYKSLAGGADSTEEAPGQFSLYTGGATDAYALEIKGVIMFKGSVPPANTPEEARLLKELHRVRREAYARSVRDALLKALAPTAK